MILKSKKFIAVVLSLLMLSGIISIVNAYTFKGHTSAMMDMLGEETFYRTFYRNFAFYLEPNGRYLHTAYRNDTDDAYYWKFEINQSTGQIYNMTTSPQKMLEGAGWVGSWAIRDEISIVADNEGYPYIGGEVFDGAQNSYWVWKSPFNNGTWNLEEFPDNWSMELEWIANGGGNPPNDMFGGSLLPIGVDDIMCVFWYRTQAGTQELHRTMYYDNSTDDWINAGGAIFNDNEGGDWEEYCFNYAYNVEAGFNVAVKQHESNPDGKIGLEALIFNYSTHTWGSNFQVSFDESGDAGAFVFHPFASINDYGEVNFIWYYHGNTTIWLNRMYSNGTMEGWSVFDNAEFGLENKLFSMIPNMMGDDKPSGIQYFDNTAPNDELYYDTGPLFLESNFSIPFSYENATITGQHNGWMFRGERYTIESYVSGASTYTINFTDGVHEIGFNWNNDSKRLYVDNDLDRELVIGLYALDFIEYDDGTQYFKWEFILDVNIHDILDTSFSYELYNEEFDVTLSGDTGLTTNIYSLGAIVNYELDGDAGKTVGGDALEIHHTNSTGNGALVEIIYRRLQHVHLEWWMDVEDNDCFNQHENTGVIQMGIKYLNGTNNWIDGWYAEISIVAGEIILGGGGTGGAFIVPYISWYARNQAGNVVAIKNDIISGYPEGGNRINSEITHTQFFTDLWFNTMNSSTTIGGRVNSKYYGMDESGWLFWTNWSPYRTNVSESMFFYDLVDDEGNVTQPIDIELMKFWVRILKSGSGVGPDCDLHTWRIMNPKLSVTLAGDRMEALNTPEGVDTLVIDMPSGGWLQPITKAIQSIGNTVTGAMFSFFKMIIGGLDTFIVDILGSPVSMSQMINWIMIQGSYVTDWLSTVIAQTSSILSIFTRMITVVLQFITVVTNWIAWTLVYVVGFPLHFLMIILSAFQGGSYTIGIFTFDFSNYAELTASIVQFAPYTIGFLFTAWFVFGDIEMKGDDFEGMPGRTLKVFQWLKEIYTDVYWIFSSMQNKIMELYNFIRSHIPGIGGSGGKAE
jgi:hypothetical protein